MSLGSLNELQPLHFTPTQEANYCARCLHGFAADHTINGSSPLDEKLKGNFQKNFGFWNWLIRFLFKERTDEEIHDLFERLEQCSCNMRDPNIRRYHQLGRASEDIISGRVGIEKQRTSISLVVKFFSMLILAFRHASVRSVAKRTSPVWPTCPNDLMPFGPDNLVQGLVQWSRFIPDTLGFRVARGVIRFCGPLVVPAFISVRFTEYVIQAGRTLVDRTWDVVRHANLRKRKDFAIPFIQQAESIVFYFEIVDDEKIEVKLRLLDGCEIKAIQLFSLLGYLASDERLFTPDFYRDYDISQFVRRFDYCGTRIYNLARIVFERIPDILVFPEMFKNIEKYLAQDRQAALDFPERVPGFMTSGDIPQVSSNNLLEGETQEEEATRHALQVLSLSEPDPNREFQELASFLAANFDANQEYFNDIGGKVLGFLRFAKQFPECSVPTCHNFMSRSGTHALGVCGKCNVVRYCGRECQESAWMHPDYPHKEVCSVLHALIEAGGGEDLVFRFHPTLQDHEDPDFLVPIQIAVIDSWRRADVLDSMEYLILWGLYFVSKANCMPIEDGPNKRERAIFRHLLSEAIVLLRGAKFDLRCSAFFCPNSIHTTGREFQRCKKCNIASYCGKACQRKAWKHADYPHKQVCLMLRKLTLCGGGEDLVFRWTSAQDPAWFPPELQKEVYSNWESAGILAGDLVYLVFWGRQVVFESLSNLKKFELGPGFEDYNALVREMGGSSAGREAQPVVFHPYINVLPSTVSRDGMILEF